MPPQPITDNPPTPTPWLRDGRTIYALDETQTCNRFSLNVQGGWTWRSAGSIGSSGDRTTDAELEANAALIVRAANSHQMLVDALAGLLAVVDAMDCRPASGGGVLPIDKALATHTAREVLNKATSHD